MAVINTLLVDRGAHHLSYLTENLTLSRPQVQAYIDRLAERLGDGLAGDPELAAMKMLFQLAQREALVLSFNDCLLLIGLTFGAALVFMPLVKKPRD